MVPRDNDMEVITCDCGSDHKNRFLLCFPNTIDIFRSLV